MTSPTWFAIRGEEYMYDQGKWWRRLKVGEIRASGYQRQYPEFEWTPGVCNGEPVELMTFPCRVPCSQPFQVGDRVKVWTICKDDGELNGIGGGHGSEQKVGKVILIGEFHATVRTDSGEEFVAKIHGMEPAPVEPEQPEPVEKPAYVPPAGWRVKGDDEVVDVGDAYTADSDGRGFSIPIDILDLGAGLRYLSKPVKTVASKLMPNGGYILTPVTTPQQEMTVPCEIVNLDTKLLKEVVDHFHSPPKPLDIHLPTIESKVLAHHALRDWWFTRKMELASEANGKIEEVKRGSSH